MPRLQPQNSLPQIYPLTTLSFSQKEAFEMLLPFPPTLFLLGTTCSILPPSSSPFQPPGRWAPKLAHPALLLLTSQESLEGLCHNIPTQGLLPSWLMPTRGISTADPSPVVTGLQALHSTSLWLH